MSLIVVHGDHHIVLPFIGLKKNRIRRARAVNRYPFGLCAGNGRHQKPAFFITKQAILTRMRIDAGDGNARFRIADALEKSICNRDNGFDAGRIQGVQECA